jgi:hypothetical protein
VSNLYRRSPKSKSLERLNRVRPLFRGFTFCNPPSVSQGETWTQGQRIIRNTYQNINLRTLLNVLYLILRTLLHIRTSLNVLFFIMPTLLYVLCQWRNKAKECSITSICEYWTINLCPLSSFLLIFMLDQTSTSFGKVCFQLTLCSSLLFRIFWGRSWTNYTLLHGSLCKSQSWFKYFSI